MKKNKEPLTFKEFHRVNVLRSTQDVKHSEEWTPLEWGGALAGEVGELCNYLKKLRRGDNIPKKKMEYEVCDIITYLSLLCNKLNIDMEHSIRKKFNIVSKRWGSKYRL